MRPESDLLITYYVVHQQHNVKQAVFSLQNVFPNSYDNKQMLSEYKNHKTELYLWINAQVKDSN